MKQRFNCGVCVCVCLLHWPASFVARARPSSKANGLKKLFDNTHFTGRVHVCGKGGGCSFNRASFHPLRTSTHTRIGLSDNFYFLILTNLSPHFTFGLHFSNHHLSFRLSGQPFFHSYYTKADCIYIRVCVCVYIVHMHVYMHFES